MRKAGVALARRLVIIMHAMLARRDGVRAWLRRFRPISLRTGDQIELPVEIEPERLAIRFTRRVRHLSNLRKSR